MSDIKAIWNRASEILRERMNADTYDRWMAGIVPVRLDDGNVAVLGVSNDLFSDWLRNNYTDVICDALSAVSGESFSLEFESGHLPEIPSSPSVSAVEAVHTDTGSETAVQAASSSSSDGGDTEVSRRFSFETFVVGENNRFAHGACTAVAEMPGMAYNPLFLHSSVGLGKSHLLHAIALETKRRNPDAVVEYITTEEFSNEYVNALSHNSLPQFRQKMRNVDVLLLDDVQFLGGRTGFQEEFFHTFNALHGSHKQIVLASDRPPQEINGLEKRLVSRFEWGLMADIQAPDLETRIAIIRKKQETQEVKLPDAVINFLASSLKSNVRRLEGALMSLIVHAKFDNKPVTIEAAESVLNGILSEETVLTVEQIQKVVAEHFNLRLADMTSKRRPANIALPRQIAMYFSRKLTDLSYPEIAEQFEKNHATILHAVNLVEEKLTSSQDFRHDLQIIERKLKG